MHRDNFDDFFLKIVYNIPAYMRGTGYVTGGGLYEGMACLAKEDCFSGCAGVCRASADCEYGIGIYKSAKKFQGAGGDAGAEMPQGTGVQHPGAGRDLRQ